MTQNTIYLDSETLHMLVKFLNEKDGTLVPNGKYNYLTQENFNDGSMVLRFNGETVK